MDVDIDLDISRMTGCLEPTFNYDTGKITGFTESTVEDFGSAADSSSMLRDAGPYKDFVRGSNTNAPFLPGGMEKDYDNQVKSEQIHDYLNGPSAFPHLLPGLTFGVEYNKEGIAKLLLEEELDNMITSTLFYLDPN